MPRRILMLTQWFDPEPGAKGLVFARALVKQGFDVEVVTGFPNYPGGKIYPGYKMKLIQRQLIDGVHITRLPLYPSHDQSAIKRILNYASFAASSLFYGLLIARRADVMYAYHPPLTVGVTAVLIRFFRRIPLVYDIQDLWPDTLAATGMIKNTTVLRLIEGLCGWVYRHCDFITVLSPGFKRRLIERGVAANKLSIIYNWADEASLTASSAKLSTEFPGQDHFRILFAGNMGKAQALDIVLEAALLLKDRCPHICLILVGDGVEKNRLMEKAKEMALNNVLFLPRVSMTKIGVYLSAADALLVNLSNDPLFEITIPSKTQAYMAAGKPILMAVSGDAADLLRLANAGVAVAPGSASLLSEAAQYLANLSPQELKALGQNASTFYNENMSLRIGVQSFKQIFNEAIQNHQ